MPILTERDVEGDPKGGRFQIAIDGPVAAGKGSVSKLVAERLGILYVDTGATYRVAALLASRSGFDFESLDREEAEDVERLVEMVDRAKIEMWKPGKGEVDGRLITVVVDGEDVSWAIREEEVSKRVPVVAKIAQVREKMVEKQQVIARSGDVVMEGRDITYRVLPEAQMKIYLDASMEERVERRYRQWLGEGKQVSREQVRERLIERDRMDRERVNDPLKLVDGAWHLDTTGKSIDQVVDEIMERVTEVKSEQ